MINLISLIMWCSVSVRDVEYWYDYAVYSNEQQQYEE